MYICMQMDPPIKMGNICPCRFKAIAAKSKQDLVSQGFTEFTIEDFHNTVCESVLY